jgi:hypothetical protein
MAPIEQKQILRVKDIFAELGEQVPISSLYKIIVKDKKMIYFRVGRAICVTRESFREFLASNSAK